MANEKLNEMIMEEIRKYKGLENIHEVVYSEQETGTTANDRPVALDKTKIVKPGDPGYVNVKSPDEKTKVDWRDPRGNITEAGKFALKMHHIWSTNLTQIMNFNKGEQLATEISATLQSKTGLPANQMRPIIKAVIKATLEQLSEEAESEIANQMPGLLDKIRG